MSNNIILSIIIPVYNCEAYIDECILSLIGQPEELLRKTEIIIVDDGSTDSTLAALKKYERYNFIKIIEKTNGGVSSARNTGMNSASGLYITFIDGDDWVSAEYLNKIFINLNRDPDILIFNLYRCFKSKQVLISVRQEQSTLPYKFIHCPILMNSVYSKIIRRKIIAENNIRFDESLSASEDLLFVFKIFALTGNYSFIDDPLYNYRFNSCSAIQNPNLSHIESTIAATKEIESIIKQKNMTQFEDFLICQKLSAKKPYLIIAKYYNVNKWINTFPEVNEKAPHFSKGITEKIMYFILGLNMPVLGFVYAALVSFSKRTIKKFIRLFG